MVELVYYLFEDRIFCKLARLHMWNILKEDPQGQTCYVVSPQAVLRYTNKGQHYIDVWSISPYILFSGNAVVLFNCKQGIE